MTSSSDFVYRVDSQRRATLAKGVILFWMIKRNPSPRQDQVNELEEARSSINDTQGSLFDGRRKQKKGAAALGLVQPA